MHGASEARERQRRNDDDNQNDDDEDVDGGVSVAVLQIGNDERKSTSGHAIKTRYLKHFEARREFINYKSKTYQKEKKMD